jgi:hypothetical protein
MTGGLLQIVSYGGQDLFLTGNPEITFFKVVYRRHTNFSIESRELVFDDLTGFGKQSTIIFPKIGDLIHKTYVKVTLPAIALARDPLDFGDDLKQDADDAFTAFALTRDFMIVNIDAYRQALDAYDAVTTVDPGPMKTAINNLFSSSIFNGTQSDPFVEQMITDESGDATKIYMSLISTSSPSITKEEFKIELDTAYAQSQIIHKYYSDTMLEKRALNEDRANPNLLFAWADRVGHAIIDTVELDIGGYCVDKQFGEWLNIWYELAGNKYQEKTYNKMIGNVSALTSFDRTGKKSYTLYIPLQFWFCRKNGLSLPLIALQHQDVSLRIKFKKMHEISYMEDGKQIYVNDISDPLYLDEVSENLNLDIEVSILAEQVQLTNFKDVKYANYSCLLDYFHPCKELIWVAKKKSYRENTDGHTRPRWDNFSLTDNNKGNPIKSVELIFNSYVRIEKRCGDYFNYVIPDARHTNTPSDGINVYSFSVTPEEFQPSGTANFSKLTRVTMNIEFDEKLSNDENEIDIIFTVYVTNYNILRFVGGMAGCAYIC